MDRADELLQFIREIEKKAQRSQQESDDIARWHAERIALLNQQKGEEHLLYLQL